MHVCQASSTRLKLVPNYLARSIRVPGGIPQALMRLSVRSAGRDCCCRERWCKPHAPPRLLLCSDGLSL